MNHQRLLPRKIPSFSSCLRSPDFRTFSKINTKSAAMTSKQQDMPHPTIDTLRDDPSRRRFMNIRKPRIIIIGGSYAGMSAALTLAALKDGRSIPFASYGDYCHLRDAPPVQDFNITIIDRRDGFCKYLRIQGDIQMQATSAKPPCD